MHSDPVGILIVIGLVVILIAYGAFNLWLMIEKPDVYFRWQEDKRQAARAKLEADAAKKQASNAGWAKFGGTLLGAIFRSH